MSDPQGSYVYFRDPLHFSTWTDEPLPCDGCGEEKPGFHGPFVGEDELDFLCEACLMHGVVGEYGATTNDGDLEALRAQLAAANPQASAERIAAEVERKTVILTEKTPPIASYDPMRWPAHCGDYCEYVKEAGRADVTDAAHAQGLLPKAVFECMRPGSPTDNYMPQPTAVYLFECRQCKAPVFTWEEAEDFETE